MFYLLHGTDSYAIQQRLADLKLKVGDDTLQQLNIVTLDGRGLQLGDLQRTCDTLPFLGDKRLVIVRDLLKSKPAYLKDLAIYLATLPESTRLVLVENATVGSTHPISVLVKKLEGGFEMHFGTLKGANLERWVRDKVAASGGRIEPAAAHLLSSNVGSDTNMLMNEIEKLVLYRGSLPIEPGHVELLCPYVAEASIFELVDAIGSRNGHLAAMRFQKKIAEGTQPTYLFTMIVRQFRLLIQVSDLVSRQLTSDQIANYLDTRPFVVNKLIGQARNYTIDQLIQIYNRLLEIDVNSKTGRGELATDLPLLIAGVTA